MAKMLPKMPTLAQTLKWLFLSELLKFSESTQLTYFHDSITLYLFMKLIFFTDFNV